MATRPLWQHRIPQSIEDSHEEEVRPLKAGVAKPRCASCGQPIMAVDENEGPEALKSLLRL